MTRRAARGTTRIVPAAARGEGGQTAAAGCPCYHPPMAGIGLSPTLVDETLAAFVTQRVSIVAASRDHANVPSLTRAIGCRVADDRRTVTVFVDATQAGALLADVLAAGVIAVVFSQPSTHRTFQLKGVDAARVPVSDADRECIARYADMMVEEILQIGQPEAFTRAMLAGTPTGVVAIAFTPCAAFDQTPGPRAGARLGS